MSARPGPHHGPARAAQRLFAAVCVAPVLLVAAAGSVAFVSSLYASTAADLVRQTQGRSSGRDAAAIAVRLAPWRSAHHRYLAQSLSADAEWTRSIEHGERAVQTNPADGYAWLYLARLAGTQPPLGARVRRMYEMALTRTPHSLAVHRAIAFDGVQRWRFGDPPLRALWRDSMAYTLQRDRAAFLFEIARLRRDQTWCAAQRGQLPIDEWCANVAYLRAECAKPALPAKSEAWCRERHLLPLRR
ncbi:hypothetical protein AAG565_01700 [Fontimonas sp. SYSU GA230001]|uniref:hypothetical protein n=1 Tax=Fontimonas sp. SYSU GA230001 TaxID=3142450 RepID=UPI0032B344B5